MGKKSIRRPAVWVVALLMAVLVAAPVLLASGCGSGNTPEGAVQKLLSAWQALDWQGYKNAIAPGQKLTKDQEEIAKQKFKGIKVKYENIKTQTQIDPKDKNKATVTLVSGKATYTADILGKQKTETQDIARMDPKARPVYDVVKINGVWYVDTTL
ncbi:MAG: hypothetical protein ACYC99_12530 [Candidatus Geothermincolia bacterium]